MPSVTMSLPQGGSLTQKYAILSLIKIMLSLRVLYFFIAYLLLQNLAKD